MLENANVILFMKIICSYNNSKSYQDYIIDKRNI